MSLTGLVAPPSPMKASTIKTTACALSIAVLLSGCEGLTPGESAATLGSIAGVAAGAGAAAAGMRPGQAAALGLGVGAAVGVLTYVVAKHEADEQQRRIAEANARRAAEIRARRIAANKERKKTRYIAVKTSRTPQSTGAVSCMVYDTEKKKIVNDEVYDCKKKPADGEVAKFDNYEAEYVGT